MFGKVHIMAKDAVAHANANDGTRRVEERASRSVDEIYMRMLVNGEINTAMKLKSTNESRARAVALMENSLRPPIYMKDGEVHELRSNMNKLSKALSDAKLKKAEELKNDKIASKAIEDYKQKQSKSNDKQKQSKSNDNTVNVGSANSNNSTGGIN